MPYTNWLSKTSRVGAIYTTPNVTIPAGVDTIRVQLNVTPTDFDTPARSVLVSIEIYTDGVWREEASVQWIGGPLSTPPPGKTAGWFGAVSGIGQHAGKLAHAIITQNGTFSWGLKGDIV
jgi:hypothetical protein